MNQKIDENASENSCILSERLFNLFDFCSCRQGWPREKKKNQPMMCLMLTFRSRELGAQNDAKKILKRVASLTEHLIVACIVHSGRAWILQGIFMVFSFQFPFASLEALKPPRHLPRQIFTWMDSIRSLAMLWILTLFAHFPQLLSITAPQKRFRNWALASLQPSEKSSFVFWTTVEMENSMVCVFDVGRHPSKMFFDKSYPICVVQQGLPCVPSPSQKWLRSWHLLKFKSNAPVLHRLPWSNVLVRKYPLPHLHASGIPRQFGGSWDAFSFGM